MRKQCVFLEHGVYCSLIGRYFCDILPAEKHLSFCWGFKSSDDPKGRGLSATGWTQKRQELVLPDIKIHIVQYGIAAESLGDVFQIDHNITCHNSCPLSRISVECSPKSRWRWFFHHWRDNGFYLVSDKRTLLF